jgi:prepilin-type N-terminal cleavage/methylation domain-containing protein
MRSDKKGFTLVELLVVLGIIAVLVGIIFPVFIVARKRARQTTCLNNLRQIGMAMNLYYDDWGRYPQIISLNLPQQTRVCPLDPFISRGGAAGWPGIKKPLSYAFSGPLYPDDPYYNTFYNVWLKKAPLAGPIVVCYGHWSNRFSDPLGPIPPAPGVFVDGHVAWCKGYLIENHAPGPNQPVGVFYFWNLEAKEPGDVLE